MFDTKIKNQFLRISVTAFILSLIRPSVSAILYPFTRIILYSNPPYIYTFVNYVDALVIYAIAPVFIFAVFYFIGKKSDLKLKLRPILQALLTGNIISFFFSSIIYSAIMPRLTAINILTGMLNFIVLYLVADLLTALAGLSIGYIRQKKLTLPTESELS